MTPLRKPLLPIFNGQTMLVTRPFRLRLKFLTPLVLLLAVWCILSPTRAFANAATPNPGVLPPPGPWFGSTYGAWSAAWWQYVLGQPTSSNPLNDATGKNCRVGQSGPVFFLVGAFGTATATRDQCTVPAGKALFFPLVNEVDIHVECTRQTLGVCDFQNTPDLLWADLQSLFQFNNIRDATSELHTFIDGVPVSDLDPATTPYRACAGPAQFGCTLSPAFSVTLQGSNLFGLKPGVYSPAVADGFYLLLAPLTPGPHTINFGGTLTFSNLTMNIQDITYHLTVLPS